MDIVSEESLGNTIIIPNITEAEAYFMPLIIENQKYFNNCEIKASSYDIVLSQLIIILNNSNSVLNSNCVYFKDQKYAFHKVDRRKIIIKWKDELNSELASMLIDNIFKSLKTDYKQIANDLLLITVDQNINFEILIKRVEKIKTRCSIHLVPHNNSGDDEIYDDKYFMNSRKTYFDLILEKSKLLNTKSTNKECQTDSKAMNSLPQICTNKDTFINESFLSGLNNNISLLESIQAINTENPDHVSETDLEDNIINQNAVSMVLGENNESENQFPSFSRTGQAFFVDASDGAQMEDSIRLIDKYNNRENMISFEPRNVLETQRRPISSLNDYNDYNDRIIDKLPNQDSKLFIKQEKQKQNIQERSTINQEAATFQPIPHFSDSIFPSMSHLNKILSRTNSENQEHSTIHETNLNNMQSIDDTSLRSSNKHPFLPSISLIRKQSKESRKEEKDKYSILNIEPSSNASSSASSHHRSTDDHNLNGDQDLKNFFTNLLKKNKKEEQQSTIQNQETHLNTLGCINNTESRQSNEDLRRLNTNLTRRVDDLENKMKIMENKFNEFSKKTINSADVPRRDIGRLFTAIGADDISSSSDTSEPERQWVDMRRGELETPWVGMQRSEPEPLRRVSTYRPRARAVDSSTTGRIRTTSPTDNISQYNRQRNATASSASPPPDVSSTVTNTMRAFDFYRNLRIDSNDTYEMLRRDGPNHMDSSQRRFHDGNLTLTYNFAGNRNEKLSKEQINRFPTTKYQEKKTASAEEVCPICLDNYKQNDELRILSCFDKFHTKCIDHWLEQNNNCPCCKYNLLKHLKENRDT